MLAIFTIIINFALFLVFFRFLIQLAQIDHFNPVVVSLNKATMVIDLLSKAIPTVAQGRVNLACLVVLVILYLIKMVGISHLSPNPIYSAEHLMILTFVTMVQNLITFCRYLIFASIIVSWVMMLSESRSPFIDVIQDLAEPLIAPFRKISPDLGMIDLSPMLAIFALLIAETMMEAFAQLLLQGF